MALIRVRASWRALLALTVAACASVPEAGRAQVVGGAGTAGTARIDSAARQPANPGLIPANYGSLKRDDLALTVQLQGLTIRAIPLDESVIRALAPDSYTSLHALREAHATELDRMRPRLGLSTIQAWYVQYFNVQQGEARYDPRDVQIRSAGRDFRPLDVIPLVTGFQDGRLAQGRSVDAIFAFDPAVSVSQPLVVTLGGKSTSAWADQLLGLLERERAAIWSRAAVARRP